MANGDNNARFTQRGYSSSIHSGIRICDATNDSFHLGGDQSIAAWRGAFAVSHVATRLQIDVDRCAPREAPGVFEGEYLCMFDAFIAVKALAHYDAIAHDNRSYQRVGFDLAFTFGRQRKR